MSDKPRDLNPLVEAGGLSKAGRSHARLLNGLGLLAARLALLAALIGLWQLVVIFNLADRIVTGTPYEVGAYLWQAVQGRELWINLAATMQATVIAFVLASLVGVLIGITLALLPQVEKVVEPFLSTFNAMPRIALAPIFIVAFGLTMTAKVAVAFSIVIFIMIVSARAGVRSVDNDIMRLAYVLGASRRQLFAKVLVPTAIPTIFGGLRLAVIYSLLGVVTAELIGSTDGMGQLLQEALALFQINKMYGLLIVLAIVASLMNMAMGLLERYLLRWQP